MNDDYLNGYQKVSSLEAERRQYIGLEKQGCDLLGISLCLCGDGLRLAETK